MSSEENTETENEDDIEEDLTSEDHSSNGHDNSEEATETNEHFMEGQNEHPYNYYEEDKKDA
jgi:hypothetical protein